MSDDYIKNENERDHRIGQSDIDKRKRELRKKEKEHDALMKKLELEREQEIKEQLREVEKSSKASGKSKQRIINNYIYRKDLSGIFKGFTRKQNIKFNRAITTRFKTINYNSRSKGINSLDALNTSLNHSTRRTKNRTEEWLDELCNHNLYYHQGKYLEHSDFVEKRDDILSFYTDLRKDVDNQSDSRHKEELNRLSKLRSSYKNKIMNLLPKDHPDRDKLNAKLSVFEQPDNKDIDLTADKHKPMLNQLQKLLTQRYNQLGYSPKKQEAKFRVLQNYLVHRSNHIRCKAQRKNRKIKNKNNAQVVEAVFKIPHCHGDFSFISSQDFLAAAVSFYEKHFPNNKIHLAALHNDESKHPESMTGRNIHIFLDADNGTDQTYRQQYISFASQYAEQHYPEEFSELLGIDPTERHTNKIMVRCGQILQMAYLSHMQEHLFNKHQIELRFLDTDERKDFRNIQACLEETLPIEDRQQSRYNMLVDQANDLKSDLNDYQTKINDLESLISQRQEKLDILEQITDDSLEAILSTISIWKLTKLPEITNDLLTQINANPKIKQIIVQQLEDYENKYDVEDNQRLSKVISSSHLN
ncbi:hypothetical protein [uncultured Ferrimonas sp.]|uniref:hypothetical protein n=1 Tax=uncultured Ferrimonas sp. TaxID=432640 RepID=UPI0026275B87|nr:hypothetical protein [uncultured Ferrimonas sp.]